MVQRRIIDRIRRLPSGGGRRLPEFDALEMCEYSLRRRQPLQGALPSSERVVRNPRGPLASIDEAGGDARPAGPARVPLSRMPVPSSRTRVEPRLIEISRARRLRVLDEREIEVRPVPVRVGDSSCGLAATSSCRA